MNYFRNRRQRGQAALEYMLLLTVVAVVVFVALKPASNKKSLLNQARQSSEGYYNKVTEVIMGKNPDPIDGGWCPAKPNGQCECACPAPAFGGKYCVSNAECKSTPRGQGFAYCGDGFCDRDTETGEPGHPTDPTDDLFTCYQDCALTENCDQCAIMVPSASCGVACPLTACPASDRCMSSACSIACPGFKQYCQTDATSCTLSCQCEASSLRPVSICGGGVSGKCGPYPVSPTQRCYMFNTCNGTCSPYERYVVQSDPACQICANGVRDGSETGIDCGGDCPTCCGNNRTDPGEECDDGNRVNGDACSSSCRTTPICNVPPGGYQCGAVSPGTTSTGTACTVSRQCDPTETSTTCPEDCCTASGNCIPDSGIYTCGGVTAGHDEACPTIACTLPARCDPGEDCTTCPQDCTPGVCVADSTYQCGAPTTAGHYSQCPGLSCTIPQGCDRPSESCTTCNQDCGSCQCLGSAPANTVPCSGTNSGLTADTPWTIVASCGSTKCSAQCGPGYAFLNGGCVSTCGDGNIDAGEQCDGFNLGSYPLACTDYDNFFTSGNLKCTNCRIDESECDQVCGDYYRTGSEQCDMNDFGGKTCINLGLPPGNLTCDSSCIISTAGCGTLCNNGTCDYTQGENCTNCPQDCTNCSNCPSVTVNVGSCGTGSVVLQGARWSETSQVFCPGACLGTISGTCLNGSLNVSGACSPAPPGSCTARTFPSGACNIEFPPCLNGQSCYGNCGIGCSGPPIGPSLCQNGGYVSAFSTSGCVPVTMLPCAAETYAPPCGSPIQIPALDSGQTSTVACSTACPGGGTISATCINGEVSVRNNCSYCGDGRRAGTEACDGDTVACILPLTAQTGSQTCKSDCTGYGQCAPLCGNGRIDGTEQCDGGNLNGQSCMSMTPPFSGGSLSCSSDCTFNTSGCNSNSCGNGTIEAGEYCDGGNLNGETCSSQGLGGGTLSCAANCTFNTSLCTTCGNGTIEAGEVCDGGNLNGETCASQGFTSGTLGCSSTCNTFNTSLCGACGNGTVDGSELCDGGNLNGQTCVSQGFGSGTLGCSSACTFDTTACVSCGNGTIQAGEQCDGGNLNGQTCVSQGFGSGTLGCSGSCLFDTSACSMCGNGSIQSGEQCDGTNVAGRTCMTLGYTSGTLACTSSCTYDTAGCATCGDGSCSSSSESCFTCAGDCGAAVRESRVTIPASGTTICGGGTWVGPYLGTQNEANEVCKARGYARAAAYTTGTMSSQLVCSWHAGLQQMVATNFATVRLTSVTCERCP